MRTQDAGIAPNAVVYNSAIRACATQALWPVALSLFNDLRDDETVGATAGEKVAPSTISYNAALAACERGGQWEEVRRWRWEEVGGGRRR